MAGELGERWERRVRGRGADVCEMRTSLGWGAAKNSFPSGSGRELILQMAASLPALDLVIDTPPAVGEFQFQEATIPKERNRPKMRRKAKFLGT